MRQAPAQLVVSPNEVLAAREARAELQGAALAKFARPLICLTLVMPGPAKNGCLSRRVMEIALEQTDALIGANRWSLLSREVCWRNAGPEAIYVLDEDAEVLKRATMHLEEHHPIGRLWDMDVITS